MLVYQYSNKYSDEITHFSIFSYSILIFSKFLFQTSSIPRFTRTTQSWMLLDLKLRRNYEQRIKVFDEKTIFCCQRYLIKMHFSKCISILRERVSIFPNAWTPGEDSSSKNRSGNSFQRISGTIWTNFVPARTIWTIWTIFVQIVYRSFSHLNDERIPFRKKKNDLNDLNEFRSDRGTIWTNFVQIVQIVPPFGTNFVQTVVTIWTNHVQNVQIVRNMERDSSTEFVWREGTI